MKIQMCFAPLTNLYHTHTHTIEYAQIQFFLNATIKTVFSQHWLVVLFDAYLRYHVSTMSTPWIILFLIYPTYTQVFKNLKFKHFVQSFVPWLSPICFDFPTIWVTVVSRRFPKNRVCFFSFCKHFLLVRRAVTILLQEKKQTFGP